MRIEHRCEAGVPGDNSKYVLDYVDSEALTAVSLKSIEVSEENISSNFIVEE
jgi:hypothetical protein